MTTEPEAHDALRARAERGDPRGAAEVLAAARIDAGDPALAPLAPAGPARRWALPAAAVVLVALAIGGAVWLARSDDPAPVGPTSGEVRCTDLMVYLEPTSNPADRAAVGAVLRAAPGVESVQFLDQDVMLQQFRVLFREEPTLLENVEASDLPPAFRVEATDPSVDEPLAALEEQLRTRPDVFEVRAMPAELRCDPEALPHLPDDEADQDTATTSPVDAAEPTTTSPPADLPTTDAEARAYVLELQQRIADRTGGAWESTRLIDHLPNVRVGSAPDRPIVDTVVVGRVVGGEPGSASTWPSGDADGFPSDGRIEVPFDSPDAMWRSVRVTVEVTQDLGRPEGEASRHTLEVGFAIGLDTDVDAFVRGLRAFGPMVFFANSDSPVYAPDGLVGIAGQGLLVATVADDGTLALPFLDEAMAAKLLADSPTLDVLVAAADAPVRTISPMGGG